MPVEAHKPAGMGEGYNGSLALACHSTMKPYFYGVLDIFHKLSQFWSPLILSLQAVFSKTTGVLPGSAFQAHFPARMTRSGWDVQAACRPCLPVYFVPTFNRPSVVFSFDPPKGLLYSQLISPPWGESVWVWGLLLTFSFPPGLQSFFWFLFFLCSLILLG